MEYPAWKAAYLVAREYPAVGCPPWKRQRVLFLQGQPLGFCRLDRAGLPQSEGRNLTNPLESLVATVPVTPQTGIGPLAGWISAVPLRRAQHPRRG